MRALEAFGVWAAPLAMAWRYRSFRPSPRAARGRVVCGTLMLGLLCGACGTREPAVEGPWLADRPFRIPIAVESPAFDQGETQVEGILDTTTLSGISGSGDSFAPESLRIVEVGPEGEPLREGIPWQLDFHPGTKGRGRLSFVLHPRKGVGSRRLFHVYYGTESGGPFPAQAFEPRVLMEDGISYAGQESFRITTLGSDRDRNAVYYFHKKGAAIAGLVDADGNEWVGYDTVEGHLGTWRGIPNLGWDGADEDPGFGHPGYTTATSEVLSSGPLRVTIGSHSTNGRWESRWTFRPEGAFLEVVRVPKGRRYWFLYEGTPGGGLRDDDRCLLSSGESFRLDYEWSGDLVDPEWVAFANRGSRRSLFLIHLDDDRRGDSYYKLESMTVFGFGRGSGRRYLEGLLRRTPNRFVVGFVGGLEHREVDSAIQPLLRRPRITWGRPQSKPVSYRHASALPYSTRIRKAALFILRAVYLTLGDTVAGDGHVRG